MDARTLSLGLLAPLFWGTTFTFAKPVVSHFPPLFMMLVAYSFIALVLAFNKSVQIRTPYRSIFLIALFSVTAQGAFVFWGLRGVDATTANLVLQLQVPAAVLLGWLLNGERMTPAKITGTVIALAGVAIVIGLPQQKPPFLPTFFVTIGGITWALGQVLAQKLSLDSGLGMLKGNAYAGLPQLAIATMLFESGQLQAVSTATPQQWLLLAFCIFFGFYLAYATWFALLKRAPMNVAAPFTLLMTPIGLATAVIFLGERMSGPQIAGAAVLLAGLAIVNGLRLPSLKAAI
jgi:O-acetylserine/cysteine efflux transporter